MSAVTGSIEWDAAWQRMIDATTAQRAGEKRWEEANARVEKRLPPPSGFVDDKVFAFADADWVLNRMHIDDTLGQLRRIGWVKQIHPTATIEQAEAAMDRVRDYRAQREAIEREEGFTEVNDIIDDLGDEDCEARYSLLRVPAPSPAQALWKLEAMFGSDRLAEEPGDWAPEYRKDVIQVVMADCRRFLGGAS